MGGEASRPAFFEARFKKHRAALPIDFGFFLLRWEEHARQEGPQTPPGAEPAERRAATLVTPRAWAWPEKMTRLNAGAFFPGGSRGPLSPSSISATAKSIPGSVGRGGAGWGEGRRGAWRKPRAPRRGRTSWAVSGITLSCGRARCPGNEKPQDSVSGEGHCVVAGLAGLERFTISCSRANTLSSCRT